ncbi:zinc ribbon domain-containing protein [Bacillus sp. T3]|uniref:zinc ribbon domain-containing protein n=1 Tax=Bacillus sp. T3 TaxID=467262 RepID=UPI002980D50E|nr:zinc ribbon domain-containing protein [Bacillus sp. T3]
MKNDSAIKMIGYSILGIIILWLAKAVLFPTGYGVSVRYTMPGYSRNGYGYEHTYNSFNSFNSLTSSFIQILFFVFLVALIVGAVMVVKNYLFTPEDIAEIKGSFIGKANGVTNPCVTCGKEINPEWKVCPHCGKDVGTKDRE